MLNHIIISKTPLYSQNKYLICCIVSFTACWMYFFVTATDVKDWWIENILVILFFAGLYLSRNRFKFSNTSLSFLFLFLLLHIYGAGMAYTQNQLGEFLQNKFQLSRNPYDRIVHFSFGFLILYPFAELICNYFPRKNNFIFLLANMSVLCLATVFELIEWTVAACTDKITGETYVATQGDPWDAQKDIVLALIGSVLMTYILKMMKKNNARAFNNKIFRGDG